ncbi:MAG TPA: 16S rRNA processing protein RimM [Saprospiraceae bacterium]|nr:16S rRNA processing protein RimM [Saprospiraceae bacterium]
MQPEYIQIGRLGKPYGLKGAVKVLLWDEYVGFRPPKQVLFVQQRGDIIPFFFKSFQEQGGHLLVVFEDFDNPNAAYAVAQKPIFVRKQDLPEDFLEEEDTELDAILGFQIVDKQLGLIGPIIDYDEQPHQSIILVDYQGREVMIPWVDAYIQDFDLQKRVITMDLPLGLL